MALEQRFVFDGAGAADAADTGTTAAVAEPTPSPAEKPAASEAARPPAPERQAGVAEHTEPGALFEVNAEHQTLSEATVKASEQIRDFLAKASDAQLFELFGGDQAGPSERWTTELTQLRASIADGSLEIGVSLLDNAQIKGALAAYAPAGPDGVPVIFVNRDWLSVLDAQQVSRLLVEEYGHHIDYFLNQGVDTPGDEGQRFAAEVSGIDAGTPGFAEDDDHAIVQIEGEALDVEFATLTFSNAYEVNVGTTPAGKESNSHDFVFTSLGQTSVTDATNSRFFSGNDVSATALTVGSSTYYGWISRPIKSGGIVRGFYFWTDADFTSLAAAQADGNQDGDSNVADNRGFLLVIDQEWFNSVAWKNQAANLKNVGSSSDRVDAALNSFVGAPLAPVANADVANGTPGTAGGAAVEAGGTGNGTAGSAAIGNVLTNDTSGDSKTVTAVGASAASQTVSATTTSANGTAVTGLYGTLTLGADGSYRYVVNDANAQVQALRGASDTLVDTFTYRMTDASGATATTTLSVTIQGANDTPAAGNDYNVAKESIAASGQYSASDASGSLATGNVLANDTDVDRGDTKTIADLTGSAVVGAVSTTTTAATLVFTPGTTFNPIGNGDKAWILVNGTYRAMFSSTGVQITATSGYDSTARTISLSATPATYYDGGSRVAIATLDGQKIGFKSTTDTTTTGTSSMKIGDVATSQSTGTSTITLTPSSTTGLIATGMLVAGTGVQADTYVQSVTYDAAGKPTSIVLNKTMTGSANTTLSFYAATGTTLTGQYGSLLLNADGSYTYTPTANNTALSEGQSGTEQFQYTMRDASGATSSATLFITAYGSGTNDPNAMNDAVEATEAAGTANATGAVNPTGNLLGNDGSGANLVVSARATDSSTGTAIGTNTVLVGRYGTLTLSSNGSYSYVVDNINPTVQALRDSSATLSETFLYTVENGQTANGVHLQDTATLTVTIRGANDAPVAGDTSASALEAGGVNNGTAGYNPSGNVLNAVTDVDDARSELRVTAVRSGGVEGSGSAGTVGSALAGQYGSLTINADGSWTYTVNNNNPIVQALNPGQTLTERFNYTVTDRSGSGLSDMAVLTLTIDGAADTVAVNSVFVNEASPHAIFTVSGATGVSVSLALSESDGLPSSDTRASLSGPGADVGNTLEYFDGNSWLGYTPGSSVLIPGGNQLLVRVAINQDAIHEGNESFTLIATTTDGSRSFGIGTINDEGEGVVYLASNQTGTPDTAGSGGYPTLDDDRPTISISSVSVNEGETAEFLVSIDRPSSTPISFSPNLVSGTATLGIDTAPAAQLERFDGNSWITVAGPVSIGPGELSVRLRIATVDDSLVESDETFTLQTGAISGTVINADGAAGSATARDNDVPSPSNRAPFAGDDSLTATEDTAVTFGANQLLGNDGDADGDTLTITSVTSGTGGNAVLNPDGTVTFTPDPGFNGAATFTYTVTDGSLISNSATVSIDVAAVNDAPVAINDSLTATEDTAVTFGANQLLGNDGDADGDTLTIASVTSGTGGNAVLNPDGTVQQRYRVHRRGGRERCTGGGPTPGRQHGP